MQVTIEIVNCYFLYSYTKQVIGWTSIERGFFYAPVMKWSGPIITSSIYHFVSLSTRVLFSSEGLKGPLWRLSVHQYHQGPVYIQCIQCSLVCKVWLHIWLDYLQKVLTSLLKCVRSYNAEIQFIISNCNIHLML